MAAPFLHGIETITLIGGPRAITEAKSAVIFLVGTAVTGPVNVPTLCLSDVDDAQFLIANTPEVPGNTIPQALRAIRAQGAALVIVVNVRDGSWTDPTAATKIIGGASGGGIRSGLALVDDCYSLFGFAPKLLLAPGFSPLAAVAAELVARADKIKGYALIDAPVGTSVGQAIAGRGNAGTINFNIASARAILCYPYVKAFDPAANATVLQPMSQFAAGTIAAKDNKAGVGYSPSNTEMANVLGMERSLTASFDDPNCEVNLLNAAGICTVYSNFGTGILFWGNRAANFPTKTGLETFICCGRAKDALDEAIRFFAFAYTDKPSNNGLIDDVVMSVDAFIGRKTGKGEYLGGKCWFDPVKNPPTQVANGQLVFSYKFMPAPPMERATFESMMTGEYAVNLKSR